MSVHEQANVTTLGHPVARTVDPATFVQIASLALESHSAARFYRDALACIGMALDGLFASLHVLLPTETLRRDWHQDTSSPAFWESTTHEFLTEALASGRPRARLYRSHAAPVTVALLSAPITSPTGDSIGAIAVLCGCDEERLEERLAALCSLADFTSHSYLPPVLREERSGASADGAAGLGRALRNAADYESRVELAFSVINQLQAKSGCLQCALGRVRGHRIEVQAISGFDEVKKRSPGIIQLQQAMEECLDHSQVIVCQDRSDWHVERNPTDFRLHRQWHEAAGGDAVACIPLEHEGRITHVLSLRRGKSTPFSEDEIDRYRELTEPYGAALLLIEAAQRGVTRHTLEAMRQGMRALLGRGSWGRKALAMAGLLVSAWFCFGTMPYRVHVPCRVVSAEVRSFCAPESAVLRSALVEAGDRVEAEQVLCSFSDDELRLELAALEQERARFRLEQSRALAEGDRVVVGLSAVTLQELAQQRALIERRLAALEVRAPHAGTIVSGDLRTRVGDRLSVGELLYELAPNDGWLLELHIPESDIEGISAGLAGRFTTFARPDLAQHLRLLQIDPAANPVNGRNVFRAEARADTHEPWIRPGMEGLARLELGERPVWWVALHRVIGFFRMHLWV